MYCIIVCIVGIYAILIIVYSGVIVLLLRIDSFIVCIESVVYIAYGVVLYVLYILSITYCIYCILVYH